MNCALNKDNAAIKTLMIVRMDKAYDLPRCRDSSHDRERSPAAFLRFDCAFEVQDSDLVFGAIGVSNLGLFRPSPFVENLFPVRLPASSIYRRGKRSSCLFAGCFWSSLAFHSFCTRELPRSATNFTISLANFFAFLAMSFGFASALNNSVVPASTRKRTFELPH